MTIWLPTVDGPTDLPDLRQWMIDHWRPGTPIAEAFNESPWVRRTLKAAALWWIEPDTCEVLAASAPTIPADTVFNLHDMPTPSGLAIFAHNLEGTDADPMWDVLGGKVRVSGVMWGPITLGGFPDGVLRDALSIASFSRSIFRDGTIPNDEIIRAYPMLASILGGIDTAEYKAIVDGTSNGGIADRYPKTGDLFSYLGRSDWLPGARPDDEIPGDDISATTAKSKAEDRRLVAALWALTRATVATVTTPKIPRPVVRRAERKGLDPKVRVLRLGGERTARAEHAGVSDVEWKHSWIVSPHFRWQAHGPGRTERKLTLIQAYRKGDPNLPLLGAERVWRVVPPKKP